MTRHRVCILFTLLFAAAVLSGIPFTADAEEPLWEAPPDAAQQINPVTTDSESTKRGRELFIKYCSTCHGIEGRGDGPVALRLITEPPDLTAIGDNRTDGELAWMITTGRNPMPSWKNKLSDKEIWDVVNFIRSLKPAAD